MNGVSDAMLGCQSVDVGVQIVDGVCPQCRWDVGEGVQEISCVMCVKGVAVAGFVMRCLATSYLAHVVAGGGLLDGQGMAGMAFCVDESQEGSVGGVDGWAVWV